MAISAAPFALKNLAAGLDAEQLRQAVASLVPNGGTGGVVQTGDLAVTAQSPAALAVNVGVGRAWLPGTNVANLAGQSYSTQGMYFAINDAPYPVALDTADSVNPRIDLIYIGATDSAYGGAADNIVISKVKGVPSATPAAPALPKNSIALATVAVAANAATITAANITAAVVPGALLTVVPVPLQAGFTNITDPCSAAKQGNLVAVTGFVQRGSGSGIIVGILPPGFRPPINIWSSTDAYGFNGADGTRFRIKILTDGSIQLNALTNSPAWDGNTWIPFNLTFWTL